MFKKIFYSLTILAMLFGMFGVMGQGGVQPVAAFSATAFTDNFAGAAVVLPYHASSADFTGTTHEGADPATTCIGDNTVATDASAWATFTTDDDAQFLHIHSQTEFDATIAVFADNLGLGVELGCQNSGAGYALEVGGHFLHDADLVIPVDPATTYHAYIIPRAFGADAMVGGNNAELWIGEFEYGGGIIVNLCETDQTANENARCDGAGSLEPLMGATVQAQLSTGGTIYTNTFDAVATGLAGLGLWTSSAAGDLFVDVPDAPAGTSYTLGISSLVDATVGDTIWFVPGVGRFLALDPDDSLSYFNSAGTVANHRFQNVGGVALNAVVSIAAAGGVLPNFELPLGTSAASTLDAFRVIPGGFYDFEAVLDDAVTNTDYFLVRKGVDCLNVLATCPLAFNTSEVGLGPWPLANPHASITRFRQATVTWDYVDFAVGAPGTNFATSEIYDWNRLDDIVVSANMPLYMDAEVDDSALNGVGGIADSDQWIMQATTPGPIPSTMAPNTALDPFVWELLYDLTVPLPTPPLADLFTTLTAPGLLGLGVGNEVPWTSAAGNSVTASYTPYVDHFGNILIAVSPIDYLRHDYFPIWPYDEVAPHHAEKAINRVTTNDPWVLAYQLLPFAFDGTVLDAVDPAYVAGSLALTGLGISRYEFERDVAHDSGSEMNPRRLILLYAISPTETRMSGHWSWSWVEGMYELGLTSGTAPGVYSPDLTITRAEMAVFLSRVLSDYSLVPPAGAGTGTAYTDVLAGFWAAGYIEQLKAYNISGDCNPALAGAQYCPDGMVTRAEMAKFIEQTFRIAHANGTEFWWNENLTVVNPGSIFVDVPAGNWAAFWIDELAVDGLTVGCRTEMSGLAFIAYFCPDDTVTRGQMAKFIVSAFAGAATQQDWPFLAPER